MRRGSVWFLVLGILLVATAVRAGTRDVEFLSQRLECGARLLQLAKSSPDLEKFFGDAPRFLRSRSPKKLLAALESVLDSEAGFQLSAEERKAMREWKQFRGETRKRYVEVARRFWTRNAVRFIREAAWNGVQKALVFQALASVIESRNTLEDVAGPAWTAQPYRSYDGDFVFHGGTHRLVIANRSSPRDRVYSAEIPKDELETFIWPHQRANSLAHYYSVTSFRNWSDGPMTGAIVESYSGSPHAAEEPEAKHPLMQAVEADSPPSRPRTHPALAALERAIGRMYGLVPGTFHIEWEKGKDPSKDD